MIRFLSIAAAIALVGPACAGAAMAQDAAADPCQGLAQAEEIACLRGALQASRAVPPQVENFREDSEAAPQSAAPTAPQATPQAPETAERPGDRLGREQVTASRREERKAPAPPRLQADAAAIRTDHLGLVTLRLDNGQVWQQTEARGVPLRLGADRSYRVEISPSGFGGYRMNFTEMGRQIVVRRLH